LVVHLRDLLQPAGISPGLDSFARVAGEEILSSDSNPRRHPDTAFRPVGDEGGLVVIPGRSEVKVLNPVAIKVFSMLDGSHSVEAIVAAVTEEFDVNNEQASTDVEAFLGELSSNGLLAVAGEKAPWEAEI
jgi:hypothetical protein